MTGSARKGFWQRAGQVALKHKFIRDIFMFCYTAGETEKDALRMACALYKWGGCGVISDLLGEEVTERAVAETAARKYIAHAKKLGALKVLYSDFRCALAIKLSQLGLKFDLDLARGLLKDILEEAIFYDVGLEIDMEGSETLIPALNVIRALIRASPHFRIATAANQSPSDRYLAFCRNHGAGVRVVKGAYEGDLAPGKDTDLNFIRLTEEALASGLDTAIGTHDEKIIKLFPEVTLQMLLGVRPFARKDFIYMPWGEERANYLKRRWDEGVRSNAANLFVINIPEAILWRVLYARQVTV